jgi:phosphatidylglycerophosphate synthase
MAAVRTGPAIGLVGQVTILAGLAVPVGLGPGGWLVGAAYGAVLCALLTRAMDRSGAARLGPADRITLVRATLVGAVTALSVARDPATPVLVAIATVALVLDGVDGAVARRSGTVSPLGARFDMEVDAFLILVLSVDVARSLGFWVVAIGAMRYAFGAASWVLPWLRGRLPSRYWRKVVAAIQGVILVAAVSGVPPRPVSIGLVATALALLIESFGRDVRWLRITASRRPAGATVGEAAQVATSSPDRTPSSGPVPAGRG